jgi:hypothetical protein
MHAKVMGRGNLFIVAFGIALGCPKHDGCASGWEKVEMFCVSIELGERLRFKEEGCEMMSRVLRLLSFVHIIYKGVRRVRVAGCWCLSSRCHHRVITLHPCPLPLEQNVAWPGYDLRQNIRAWLETLLGESTPY